MEKYLDNDVENVWSSKAKDSSFETNALQIDCVSIEGDSMISSQSQEILDGVLLDSALSVELGNQFFQYQVESKIDELFFETGTSSTGSLERSLLFINIALSRTALFARYF